MLEHNHQFAKLQVSGVFFYFHQHDTNFCCVMLLVFYCCILITSWYES